MKKENKIWDILKPIIVLVLVCAVSTAALAVTNVITLPIIAQQQAAAEEAAKKEVLPEGTDFAPVEDMSNFPAVVVAAEKAGNGAGWVITTETNGYGGVVRAMFGINAQGAIVASKVVDHGETEGIGSKVVKDGSSYHQQLVGMTKDTMSGIVATTGASFSSAAMKQAVTAVFDTYAVVSGGPVQVGPDAPGNLSDAALAEYYGAAVFTDVPGGKVSDAGTVVYGSGYGAFSDVLVAVLFDTNDQIIGLIVDASGETPDIGGRCQEREYTDTYIGATSGKEVEALSGASFTSMGIQDAVDYALENLAAVKAG